MKIFAKPVICIAMVMGISAVHAAAICDGKWAFIMTYTCDAPPTDGETKCLLIGRDKNQDGKWDEGDEFKIKFEDEAWKDVSYEQACTGGNAHHFYKTEMAQCIK
ncbi:hypothetical protein [Chromobacterium sp. CV08]|uniref:hypothetical protein n=1 Tax=Chromobacterium sp. CV08 TaxID=3133274 RepID=UPI003DA9290F